jgi:alpha-glucosidase
VGVDWWRKAVFYQVYVRSFADSDGDGVGDLEGIRSRLPYLAELGVDALWLTPFFCSPMADHGYDVADPRDVDPLFGDLATFDRLLADAHDQGIKVTVDVVPNHTSDQRAWFADALASRPGSTERARYIFRDGKGPDGGEPPNNWPSVFGGPAWTRITEPDGSRGQWYMHLFAPEQPDLDWTNSDVQDDLAQTLRFWLDRGVDGFRIDVAHGCAKPAGLPDMDQPELVILRNDDDDPRFDHDDVHDVWRLFRSVLNEYPGTMAVGEIWVRGDERLRMYIRPDELHMAFSFRILEARWRADELRDAITHSLAAVRGTGSETCWVLSNHDVVRHATRYGGGLMGRRRSRAAALLELGLPGVVYLYNGEELGLPDAEVPDEFLQDPTYLRSGGQVRGRDSCRIPLPWTEGEPPYGFSPAGTSTWLPIPAAWSPLSVEAQERDPASMLALYRTALGLRHKHPGLVGGLRWLDAPAGCLAFARDGGLVCVVNLTNTPVTLPAGLPGDVLLSSVPLTADGRLPGDATVWLI